MTDSTATLVQSFREYLRRENLKLTRQRAKIAQTFSEIDGHVSVDDLLEIVRQDDPGIGYATVYRTLKLLVDADLASPRNFGEGFARYEPEGAQHHDHLVCLSCQRIEEFQDEGIEERQTQIAERLGYRLTRHQHELFGICAECRRQHGEDRLAEVGRGPRRRRGQDFEDAFRHYLGQHGLKLTRQRELIAGLFSGLDEHVRVGDLCALARNADETIGHATVYRTLKLLVDAGLAACRHFGDGFTRFEPRDESHHDHLVDEQTGQVIEFHDEEIESRQEQIAKKFGFRISHHRHDLFGRRHGGSDDERVPDRPS